VSLEQVIVAVMTKYPDAGRVKTRLTPVLRPKDAARVHQVFVTHIVNRLKRLSPLALKIACDPPEKPNAMREMLNIDAEFSPQCAGDLGARLAEVHASSTKPILFFGVDSPDVPLPHIQRAAQSLIDADVVVGPSDDGGYWCLGLSPRVDAKRLLCDIAWSSGRERGQTIDRAKSLGFRVVETDPWDDVDRPDDLKRLCDRLKKSEEPESQNLLERLRFLPKEVLS
jgi:rSAM/selenodomain-associated transferase 1